MFSLGSPRASLPLACFCYSLARRAAAMPILAHSWLGVASSSGSSLLASLNPLMKAYMRLSLLM